MMGEIQDNMDLAMSATEGSVRPAVSVGKLEEWKQLEDEEEGEGGADEGGPARAGAGAGAVGVVFTQLAVCDAGLLALGKNGRLYRWDWNAPGAGAGMAAEDHRAVELCGGDILAGDLIVQVASSNWRTSVVLASGKVSSWMDAVCHQKCQPPSVVHNGVTCDISGMNPLVGIRYKKKGQNFDVCEAEFGKFSPEEKKLYVSIASPHGPEVNFA